MLKADGAGEFTEILTLAGVAITLAAPVLCKSSVGCEESATEIEAAPEKLPWKLLAYLGAGGELLELVEGETWSISCHILGLLLTQECTFKEGSQFELLNVAGGVEVMGVGKPFGICSSKPTELLFEMEQIAGSGDESTTGTLTISSE